MRKILLYYQYSTISDPNRLADEQRTLCQRLGLKGRIIIAHEGINGTVGGAAEAIKQYKCHLQQDPRFADVDFKESTGDAHDFPRLQVVVRPEIVHLGLNPEIITARDGGMHLTPQATHDLLNKHPDDLVILDARNAYESHIGTFKGSITPDIENFRDLPAFIDKNVELFKDKQVLMHCTGGIRCERASAYLKSKGVTKEVYQINGGIHRYIEQYPDGHFRGKLYVFDGRVAIKVNDDILAQCYTCEKPYDEYTNCVNAQCNKQITLCPDCCKALNNTCSSICQELVVNKKVVIRTLPKKASEQSTHAKNPTN